MGRMALGWQLTKQSWGVVKSDRSLLVFPAVGAVAALVVGGVLFGAGAGVGAAANSGWAAAPFIALGLYALTVIGQFAAVALAACATASLDGHDTTFGEGVAAARGRMGIILAWSAILLLVGVAISALQALLREGAGQLVSSVVGGLANLAWTVATFFVVPVIALDGLGPRAAIKRSTSVIRERWGESVVGSASVGGIVFLVGVLPGVALAVLGAMLTGSAVAPGAVLIALGVAIVVLALLVQATLTAVFRVALYRYATQGAVPGSFDETQLQGAFRPKRRRGLKTS